ncbi:MAG: hypothetical protein ACHQ50_13100 [Fimbriimonadales bacterium]
MPVLSTAVLMLATPTLWGPKGIADDSDSQVAFRGSFTIDSGTCEVRMAGASAYLVWLDGKLIGDGPARFPKAYPEYQTFTVRARPGRHVLAVHAHNDGVTTRILAAMQPFLWCEVIDSGNPVPVSWKCARIPGYAPRTHRISDILGWIDWLDTREGWPDWQQPGFDDAKWQEPVAVDAGIGPITAARTHPVLLDRLSLKPVAHGNLTENFGYDRDDPAVRFFLRDLEPKELPPQGVWRRYDLGRIRLGRPYFTLELPAGSVVEFATCEQLRHGRVHAFVPLSGSPTCNFDHFVARGGRQEFMPFTPKGGRFLEVHVLSGGPVKFVREEFLDRAYYGEPEGSFDCDDPLLNRIWTTGVNTLRSCADDGLVDCPTRERGQWTGDVVSVATDVCASAYSDLSLSRRALVQAAQAAREDGLVAGVGPGDPSYLSTYAAQWVSACVHYWELTGDKSILADLLPAAEKNLAAFDANMTPGGIRDDLGWAFVDWGYVRNDGLSDMALNIHYLMALRAMVRWCDALSLASKSEEYRARASDTEQIVRAWLAGKSWPQVGYHRAALALLAGLVDKSEERGCIDFIEGHLRACFPNDASAPRLSDPGVAGERFMTPYFCHFAFAALLLHGETDFVLGQYRKCWGWALGDGRTTWLEVFDTRWSHCHEWSGCPTWQLSRFVLGLHPRFDLGTDTYELDVHPGSLARASGRVPMPGGGVVSVSWVRAEWGVKVTISAPRPIRIRAGGKEATGTSYKAVIPVSR